ncbi:MAG: copper-binding protein [Verrucomicrobiota bacterium]
MQSPSPPSRQAPVEPELAKLRPVRFIVTVPLLRLLFTCLLLAALPATGETPPSDDCDCDASAQEQLGKPIIGTVESLPENAGRIILAHKGVPGLLRPGASEFLINATVRAVLKPGERVIAQAVPLDDGTWELTSVRRLKPVATP